MIVSYRSRRAESFANGEFVREFQGFADQAYRRLEILEAATSLDDLRALRSNNNRVAAGLALALNIPNLVFAAVFSMAALMGG